jgi:hypothetical protein
MRNSVSSIIDSLHTVNESGFNGKEFLSDLKKGDKVFVIGYGHYTVKTVGKKKFILSPVDSGPDKHGISNGDLTFLNGKASSVKIENYKDDEYIIMR